MDVHVVKDGNEGGDDGGGEGGDKGWMFDSEGFGWLTD